MKMAWLKPYVDAPASVSAIDYLKGQEVVAVYCDQSEDTFNKIVCAVSDKFYIFVMAEALCIIIIFGPI
jgi:hypothetical protein